MTKHRKDTPKRPRRSWKASEIAVLVAALGTLLTGLAALLKKNCGEAEPNPNRVSGNNEKTAEMEDQLALS